jgi:ankyrin repeat protein
VGRCFYLVIVVCRVAATFNINKKIMMNQKVLQILGGNESHYPVKLEHQFPRVLEKIIQLWDTPALDPYFNELMMDTRDGNRQGFPREIASEILRLSLVSAKQHEKATRDVWGSLSEKARQQVEQMGFEHSAKGLMQASEAGNTRAIEILLSGGVSLETRDERNWTPLMISSFNGKEAAAFLLIQGGAKIDAQDLNGYSPLHWAAFNGYDNVVRLLLRSGANPNALSNFGWTPLMQAATRGHMLVAAQLIAGGANVNIISSDNWTALHKAAANGHAGLVRLLLSKGADTVVEYQDGCTALTLATKGRYEEIISMLTSGS